MMKNFCLLLFTSFICGFSFAEEELGAPVKVEKALKQDIFQRVPLTGTVTSAQVARLSVSVGGLVESLQVEAGSRIEQGELLLTLDADLAELQTKSAMAKVDQLANAWRDSQRRLQEVKALKKNIAESTVRDLEAEVSEDQAALAQAQADLGYQQALTERHRLVAPFAGVVSAKLTELGEWVVPGQGVLELVGLDNLRIDFKVAEDYLAKIGSDAIITYTLNADPENTHQATVGTIVPVSDPAARTFLLRVPIHNTDRKIIPGLSVTAQMKVPTGRQGVVVPRDATLRMPDGRVVVWTLEKDADGYSVIENSVVTGFTYDGLIEIKEGLNHGDQVVVQGNESLQRGQKVYFAHD